MLKRKEKPIYFYVLLIFVCFRAFYILNGKMKMTPDFECIEVIRLGTDKHKILKKE
jgi:hypothetical protein